LFFGPWILYSLKVRLIIAAKAGLAKPRVLKNSLPTPAVRGSGEKFFALTN
jgi:hypothetical protein